MAITGYLIHLGVLIGVFSMLAVSLNLAVGFTGLLNLGHIAFFGIGAYTSALLSLAGVPVVFSIPIAIVVAAIAGAILALPTVRLRGDYLALATLGFAFIITSVSRNWIGLTRGALGLPGIPKIASPLGMLIIVAIIAVILIALVKWITTTRFGKTLQAIRDDELAAKTLGKNTFVHKVGAMTISAAIAGVAGALFAHYLTFIDPNIFALGDLILLLAMIIVGGLASIKGAVIGTFIIILLPEAFRFIGLPPELLGPVREMLFAFILLIILIFRPKGIFGKVDV